MNIALAVGIIVLVGFIGGKVTHRVRLPMITGYIVVGVLIRPSLLNVVPEDIIADLDIFTSIALNIIAYSIGNRLRMPAIRRMERSIVLIAPLQTLGALLLSAGGDHPGRTLLPRYARSDSVQYLPTAGSDRRYPCQRHGAGGHPGNCP